MNDPEPRQWNECPAYANVRDSTGRERIVVCDLPIHVPPEDASAEHWDDELGIYWRYEDGADLD